MRIVSMASILFICIFFFFLPFHAFGVTFLNSLFFDITSLPPFFLSGWKEIILAFFFGVSFIYILPRFSEISKEFDAVDISIIFLSVLSFALLMWKGEENGIMQSILGIKYDLFFLWIFLCFRYLPIFRNKFDLIKNTILTAGIFIVIGGLVLKFLPVDTLISFGYFDAPSVDTTQKPASFCQLLANTEICRAQSFFAGPIRLGAYLVLITGLLFINTSSAANNSDNPESSKNINPESPIFSYHWWKILLLIPIITLLFWTYSRGAWISEIVLLVSIVAVYFRIPLFSWKVVSGGFVMLSLVFCGLWFFTDAQNIIVREGSTNKHIEGITQSIEVIKNNPEGLGLGMAGPASTHLEMEHEYFDFLNENWYLQIFSELGLLGGLFFVFITFSLLWKLYYLRPELFPVFLSLSVMACFTHVWEESAVAYSLWALMGVALNNYSSQGDHKGSPLL